MNKIENFVIEIDLDNCTLCKACVNDCVAGLFYIKSDGLKIVEDFEERCILCGHCVAVCPVNVVELKVNEKKYTKEILKSEEYPNFQAFYNLVLKRKSIEKLLDLARFSPTGSNSENVYYTIIKDKEIVAKISNYITVKVKRFTETLEDPKGRDIVKARISKEEYNLAIENLPRTKAILRTIESGVDFWCWGGELIFIHGDLTIGGISTNTALSAAHIMLAAETLGLGTCSLGYLTFHANQSETIKKIIKLPENHEIGYSITIGYPKVKYKRVPPRKPSRVQWF